VTADHHAADNDTISRLKDRLRSLLAWQSVVAEITDARLDLDPIQARQATRSFEEAGQAVIRMMAEAYKQ
jgi:hypothetical protein